MADTKGGISGFANIFPNINIDDAGQDLLPGTVAYGPDQVAGTEISQYRFVKNGSSDVWTQWQALTFDSTANGFNTLIKPTTNSLDCFGGVVAGSVGITNANYGWVLTKGYGKAFQNGSGTTIVAGDNLKVANGSYNMVHDSAKGVTPAFPLYAKSIAGTASNTTAVTAVIFGP